jgi:hypothetical protein
MEQVRELFPSEHRRKVGVVLSNRFPFPGDSLAIHVAIALTLLVLPVHAAFGFKLDGTLDKTAISKSYFESDFARIRPPLEAWRTSLALKTRDDSIFVFKYLSVIYAADSTTKEKSKSFMFQLITLAPAIEIMDLYVSDQIELMFKSVKAQYQERQQYMNRHDMLGKEMETPPIPSRAPATTRTPETRSADWVWWTVGGVGMAAAVVGGYYILHDDPASPKAKSFEP